MKLESRDTETYRVVTVHEPRIDAAVAIGFKDKMRELTAGEAPHVVLDLSEVEFIDSSGLGAIVASMKQMGNGRKLHLAGLTPAVDRVFRLTRMASVFSIHDTVNGAEDTLAS